MKLAVIKQIKGAPKEPGCYIFRGKNGALYVGKAANLRARLKSYLKITDPKTQALHEEASRLDLIVLRSEIEALIEESRLIKKLKPKYNILWRDDKSYFYVAFTKEKFSRIFITHKSLNAKRYTPNPVLIGPFTDGSALRLVMRLLRRYFPYCTCRQQHLRNCLNAQIGKCLGYCCTKRNPKKSLPAGRQTNLTRMTRKTDSEHSDEFVDSDRYRKNIRAVKSVLRGNSKKLLKTLKDKKEKEALEKIMRHREFLSQSKIDNIKRMAISESLAHFTFNIARVECYDISNLAGKEAVGALTALTKKDGEWLPDKNSYRRFKIRLASTRDDPKMIEEIVTRRLNHSEWAYPDLMIIDGGIAQYKAAKKILKANSYKLKAIKIISFAKPQKLVFGLKPDYQPTPLADLPTNTQKLIEKAVYQTHRFAIRYHRQFRRKEFLKIH